MVRPCIIPESQEVFESSPIAADDMDIYYENMSRKRSRQREGNEENHNKRMILAKKCAGALRRCLRIKSLNRTPAST